MSGRARRPADVAFAAAACIALAGYNNLAGARPWHRRWYPAVNALAASSPSAAAVRNCLRPRPAPGPAAGRAQVRIGGGRPSAAFGLAALTGL